MVNVLNIYTNQNWKMNAMFYKRESPFQVDEQKTTSNNAGKLKPFTFNVVFEPEAKQEDIVDHSGIKRLVDMAIEGFSTTCFCYGQTGSGKTHTLTGPPFLVRCL